MKTASALGVILLSVALFGCAGPHQLSPNEHRSAENAARDFSERIGGKFISCSSQDSQNVGYTTCTVSDASRQIIELRCTYQADASGCKLTPKT